MSTLHIPQSPNHGGQGSGKNIARSSSASSLPPQIEHVDDLAPLSRSRRNSGSNAPPSPVPMAPATPSAPAAVAASPGAPHSPAAQAGLIPLPSGQMQAAAENESLIAPIDWQEPDHLHPSSMYSTATAISVGKDKVTFHVDSAQLKSKSPYFKKLLAEDAGHSGKIVSPEQTCFQDLDEFAMALFMHWLGDGNKLNGPHDFHSLAHYLSLYVLARRFEIEDLQNQVMDLVRHYYAEQSMTAPAYRLEYVYTFTHTPNHMRTFLISTAAFRVLEEARGSNLTTALQHTAMGPTSHYLSDSIRGVLVKDPDMATDFVEQLIELHRDGEHDARYGLDCVWHVHEHTPKCKVQKLEPWQKDGPADETPPADAPEPSEEPKKPEEAKDEESKNDEPKPEEKKPEEPKKPDPPKLAPPAGPSAPIEAKKPEPKIAAPIVPAKAPTPAAPVIKPAAPSPAKIAEPLKVAEKVELPKPHEERKYPSHWFSDTERLQWEMTERALAKNDDGLLKAWHKKMNKHLDEIKDKLHKDKPAAPPATPPASSPPAPKK